MCMTLCVIDGRGSVLLLKRARPGEAAVRIVRGYAQVQPDTDERWARKLILKYITG
jgi:hypothetical protein